jgi:cystine transport system substrate-binding protein
MRIHVSRRAFVAGLALACPALLTPRLAAAQDALAAIMKRGSIRIGLEGTYPPFNYQDENGHFAGFEIDFATALTQKLGVKPDFQPNKWDGLLAALDTGRIDVVINQVTVTEERQRKYDFTQPYTVSGIQILVRKGDEAKISKPADLAGKRVGVVLGTNYEKWLRDNMPTADIRTYDDDPTRNQDLLVGRIDAILNDRLIAGNLIKQYGGRIVPAGEPFATQKQAIALRKGEPDLLKALNTAIDELRADGTLKQISVKWFGTDVTQ